jgi:hypothetical protein
MRFDVRTPAEFASSVTASTHWRTAMFRALITATAKNATAVVKRPGSVTGGLGEPKKGDALANENAAHSRVISCRPSKRS